MRITFGCGVAALTLVPPLLAPTAAQPPARDVEFDTTRTADRRGERLPAGAVARVGERDPDGRQRGSYGLGFSPDGRLVAFVGPERDTHVWDVTTETEVHRLPHDNPANFPTNLDRRAFSADGKLLFGDGGAVWDVKTGKRVERFGPFPKGGDRPLAFPTVAPDGKTVAFVSEQHGSVASEIILYDVATRRELRRFGKGTHVGGPLVFSPDGRTLAASKHAEPILVPLGGRKDRPRPAPEDFGDVLLFDPATGEKKAERLSKTYGGWWPFAFTPNGATLLMLDRHAIVPFNVTTREPGVPFGSGADLGAALLPDGRAVVAATAGGLAVWGTNGTDIARVDQPQGTVYNVALSPGGRWLATGSTHGPVLIWDVAALRPAR
ncbi:PD40 domain-containing protein [bacterium]|nr:PD40 domain-containing protein [bacterium]